MKSISRRSWYRLAALFLVLALIVPVTGSWVALAAPGRTISGSADAVSKPAGDFVATRYLDWDGDGVDDYRIQHRLLVARYTGVMEGTSTLLQTLTRTLNPPTSKAYTGITATFQGTVGDSEPGTMTMIGTLVSEIVGPPGALRSVYEVRYVVVNAIGGLEGITGYGVIRGEGPSPSGPYVSTSEWHFRFSSASDTASMASP